MNDKVFNIQMDLTAYNNAMNSNRANIIISCLKQLGCSVEVSETDKQCNKLYKQINKELPQLKLNIAQFKALTIE